MAEFIRSTTAEGVTVVGVVGEVDLDGADGMLQAVRPCLANGENVVLDLAGLQFIDSTGLGNLVQLRKEAARTGASLTLKNVSPSAYRLFEVTGLRSFFGVDPPARTQDGGARSEREP